ncbi:protein tyrosine phosphatase family protein [Shewanella corallii]|uniref:Protein tyrosine phosphatase family protein n=1 Tax=Shewanella corallii TaxID=560080 RepID=A0ABT0NCT5_9GAMM|nr:protein tyrosine phosphatase family protein [Shewanella corallii]MCL2916263.1 protein tyrosine phosphatase family protein [Shewanella corallii]
MKKLTCAMLMLCSPLVLADITPSPQLQQIRAFKTNSPQLVTSGQPAASQFNELSQAGVDVVINLMPDSSNTEYQNEAELVEQAGMQYVYIPVDWKNPTQADLQAFFEVMGANKDKDILLHCLANYRASAFAYLYQLKQGNAVAMSEVMTPWGDDLARHPQWQKLIEDYQATLN